MRHLYPEIQCNQTYQIEVSDGHTLYVEESGNPEGIAVVHCHGGPGSGSSPFFRRFYDPELYRIIQIDQRGCGRSTPHCADDINALWHNTTLNLINDMDTVRQHLDIDRWLVCGGSWGSTLALLYAIEYPTKVLGLIVRGIFLARKQDINWLFAPDQGASQVFPEYYRQFVQGHDNENCDVLLSSYLEQLSGENDLEQLSAARQFCQWEGRISQLAPSNLSATASNKEVIAAALTNCHYFTNNSFIYEHEIISEIDRIKHIPGFIIHGRYDMVCKLENAYQLHQHWPNGVLEIVSNAGHSSLEPGITDALVRASDQMATFIKQA